MASAIPVLPLVASISVSPGRISPRASALLIMLSAGRSFTEPAGLLPSSLISTVLVQPAGNRRCRRTSGVLPTAVSMVGNCGIPDWDMGTLPAWRQSRCEFYREQGGRESCLPAVPSGLPAAVLAKQVATAELTIAEQ